MAERSAHDGFTLRFRDYLKFQQNYQYTSTNYRFEFPPASAWVVFTDIVPHAVLKSRLAVGTNGNRAAQV